MPIPKIMRAAVVENFREPLVTDLRAADGDWPVKPWRVGSAHKSSHNART